jgi:GAF domain-containing protein
VDFLPETRDVLGLIDEHDGLLRDQLLDTAGRARLAVPELVGMSVTTHDQGLVLTLVATDDEMALLDAVQYADTGPCVAADEAADVVSTAGDGLLDEDRWHLFARAAAAADVRSRLTLPVLQDGEAVGTVNLYGSTDDAFEGRHEAVADAVGGWADAAVANADLGFTTRARARLAPDLLRHERVVALAVRGLATRAGSSHIEARERLLDGAVRAGVPLHLLAQHVVDLLDDGA